MLFPSVLLTCLHVLKVYHRQCIMLKQTWNFKRQKASTVSLYVAYFNDVKLQATTTIDPKEIETFSNAAEKWWDDKKGPMRALHYLNKIRVPYFVETLSRVNGSADLKNTKILDVGCGGGILSEALAKYGAEVTGIDATQDIIAVATEHSKTNTTLETKPTYHCCTVEQHATNHKSNYDAVIASEIIEHVNNKELFVKACVETLKPGGSIFFTAPSKTRLSQAVNIWFAETVINDPPKGTHQYDKFVTPDDVKTLLEMYNCQVHEDDIRGFMYNMITKKWSWTKSKSLFYALHAVKLK